MERTTRKDGESMLCPICRNLIREQKDAAERYLIAAEQIASYHPERNDDEFRELWINYQRTRTIYFHTIEALREHMRAEHAGPIAGFDV